MTGPNAVVIPFGVPVEGRGLGLGLAALVHAFAHVEGGGVAIAQLHGRRTDEPVDTAPSLVEAVTSIEDHRFFSHGGVDYFSLMGWAYHGRCLPNDSGAGRLPE